MTRLRLVQLRHGLHGAIRRRDTLPQTVMVRAYKTGRHPGRRPHLARQLHAIRRGIFRRCRLEPIQNPFGSKVLPLSPE
jgi:hypothetical protein